MKLVAISFALLLMQACSHPIDIVGEGDVVSASGSRTCLLEEHAAGLDNCSKNYVVGAYQETYYAIPRSGWQFDHWDNYCTSATTNECTFNVPAATVQQFHGQTAPALIAVFTKYTLTGPVLPASDISLETGFQNPSYQKTEFFLSSTARSYTPTLPLPSDGKFVVTADPASAAGKYQTRLVVMRPIDTANFNGTVIVEWLNVSAGIDSAFEWIMARNEFVRSGYAWIGVSAQEVGVNALKNGASTAVRYASLAHPGDSYSYDIFSRVGLIAKESASTLLGGLTAERVLAAGESQSAFRMVTYIDAVQPVEHVYDGFLVHSSWGIGSDISQAPLPTYSLPVSAPIRDDLEVPVMVVQSEEDVMLSNLAARQPDTSMFRSWEIAGTSHIDAYSLQGLSDPGDGSGTLAMFGYLRVFNNPFGCVSSVNAGPHHWILQAAFQGLDTWVRTGVAPPAGSPLEVVSSSPVVFARDANGNVLGGVRSPHLDVPVATLDSVNDNVVLCGGGRTIPMTVEQISSLYSDKADFIAKWMDAINNNVADGFLLQADADELEVAANAWEFPN